MNNEEATLLKSLKGVIPLESFDEREQFILEALIRKRLVRKQYKNRNNQEHANEETINK